MQISLLLEMAAESFPDRAMISGPDGPITGGEVLARARAGAAWLAGQGGETLVFCGLNGPALPIALFAGAIAGMPFAPINYRLTDADLRRLLARTAPSVAIVDTDILPRVAGTPGVTLVTREQFEAACLNPATDVPESEQDIAVLLFT
ncbi:MAG: long-chain fatty acid--CoA ligase, partial [Sphingomonadales bacterium]|nr:long-chain fatty acid--CoA ligase [Sphingomonadales bacterium]